MAGRIEIEGAVAEPVSGDKKPPWPRWLTRILIGVLLASFVAGGTIYWLLTRDQETTDDAFIMANVVQIAPRVAGTVRTLHIDDNQWVRAGDFLIELDPSDYEAAVAQAEGSLNAARANEEVARRVLELTEKTTAAKLEEAEAQLAESEAAVRQAEEKVAASQAQLDYNKAEASRYGTLATESFASKEKLGQVTSALKSAAAELEIDKQAVLVAQAKLSQARAQLDAANTATEQLAEKQAQLDAAIAKVAVAEADLEAAQINLSYTRIRAPEDGFVTNRFVNPGETVTPGQTLTSLVVGRPWVVANFKETQLARIRPGQPVDISVDAYPGLSLHGHVDSIQHGSGAAFSLLPPENATGNFVKVVQRVPVKIVIDGALDSATVLGPGLSVEPTVHVGEAPPPASRVRP